MIREQMDSAIELKDKQVMGNILAGLRDLAGKNVLQAPIFHGIFDKPTIAALKKKGKTAEGFWREVAGMLLSSQEYKPILRKLPGIAEATVCKYGPSNGRAGDFWRIGVEFRDAVERVDEDRLSGLLRAVDEAVCGEVSQCPWKACEAFYGLSAPYTDEIFDLLAAVGLEEARTVDPADLWLVGEDHQYSRALARFILAHKEFWPSMCHDLTCFVLTCQGENGVAQFISMV